jgi:hypothetical protein
VSVDPWQAAVAATVEGEVAALRRGGRLHPEAPALSPGLPAGLLRMLREADEGAEEEERSSRWRHYTAWSPAALVGSLCDAGAPGAALLHRPLDPARHPRLWGAVEALSGLSGSGLPAARVQPGWSLARVYAGCCFGGCMPMLYTSAPELRALEAEAAARGLDQTLDRRMTGPLVHELAHFLRDGSPLHPCLLDECVAAWLGARAAPAQCFGSPGEDDAIYGAAWFAQVGQGLALAFGAAAVARAQSGVCGWSEVIPAPALGALEAFGLWRWRQGREPHFLSGNTSPEPWLRLIAWLGAGQAPPPSPAGLTDAAVIEVAAAPDPAQAREAVDWALQAMSLEASARGGVWRAGPAPSGRARIDWEAARAEAPEARGHAPALRYGLPFALARRWLERGCARVEVAWEGAAGRAAAVEALVEGRALQSARARVCSRGVRGDGGEHV